MAQCPELALIGTTPEAAMKKPPLPAPAVCASLDLLRRAWLNGAAQWRRGRGPSDCITGSRWRRAGNRSARAGAQFAYINRDAKLL
jgi:hypothetical protein